MVVTGRHLGKDWLPSQPRSVVARTSAIYILNMPSSPVASIRKQLCEILQVPLVFLIEAVLDRAIDVNDRHNLHCISPLPMTFPSAIAALTFP